MKREIKELVQNGVLAEEEVPFDESENVFKEEQEEQKFSLPYTYVLKDPVKYGDDYVTQLVFEDVPRVKNCMAWVLGETLKAGHYVPVIASMVRKSDVLIKNMTWRDFMGCMEVVSHFLT